MSTINADDPSEVSRLLRLAADGDEEALRSLFSVHRDRLKRMVLLRLDRGVQGCVNASDVLQEAYVEASRSLADYAGGPALPFFLWLRQLTVRKLSEIHERHRGIQCADAEGEVTLHRGGLPMVDSASLAAQLLGNLTQPSRALIKAENRLLLQDALNAMDPIDREVLALRHFEQLSTSEVAQILGLSRAAAGTRYVRAVKRLREILKQIPGFEMI
jgi:RNA polymerase sigma-70 factor (ECF subfamily)